MASRSVVASLEAQLAGMDEPVRTGALATLALAMAEQVDEKATAIMCAELAAIIKTLMELSPPAEVEDEVAALRNRVGRRPA